MLERLAVYVSSCDGYSDCWEPFFRLFERFWPDFGGRVYLGTEDLPYSFERIDMTALRVCLRNAVPKGERVPWSRFTRLALQSVGADIILFMQEDFFLRDRVRSADIERFLTLMEEHPEIRCIHLTDQASLPEGPSEWPDLDVVRRRQRYRVSCQCALWRKEEILSLLRDDESAWEYEEFGSRRSAAAGRLYLTVSRSFVQKGRYEIVPYVFTGIVQGRWYPEVVPLFKENGIEVDYSLRGLSDESRPRKPLLKKVSYQFNRLKRLIQNEFYIWTHPQGTS